MMMVRSRLESMYVLTFFLNCCNKKCLMMIRENGNM